MATADTLETTTAPRRRRTGEVVTLDQAAEGQALREQVRALEAALDAKDRRITAMKDIGRSLGAILNLDDVLSLIMGHVTNLLEADRSTLYLVDTKTRELWSKIAQGNGMQEIRMPLGVGLAGWVAKSGEPLNLRDVYQDKRFNKAVDQRTGYRTQTMLAYAMRDHRGNILGVLQALNKRGGPFTEEDERTLEAIGCQAAQAIENAVLHRQALAQNAELASTRDALSHKLAEVDLLFEFTQTLVRARDAREMVQLVLGRASALIGAEGASMLRVDGPAANLDLFTTSDTSAQPSDMRSMLTDPNEGIPGWVATHAQPVIVSDVNKDKRHSKNLPKRWEMTIKNMCGVPLMASDGACSGALVLFNRDGGFSEEHVVLLTMLANHVAKALEAARIKEQDANAQRLATIGQMLSGVVHDFKTPMTIISGYVQLMQGSASVTEREEYAELILKQFDNLSQMTKDLLQFARGDVEVLLRKVYVTTFLEEVKEMFSHLFEGSSVTYEVATKFKGSVRLDTGRMMRVITNIARNAKEAMPDGGKFKFSVEQVGESVVFTLADNGPGIPEELEGRLFTEFATHGKADGTGLGLAVVKRIVKEHHGDVTCDSRRGKGTTFIVRLPL